MDSTSATLLERLRQPNAAQAWGRFAELYTPFLLAWARQLGIPPQDAPDLIQEVMITLLRALPEFRYDQKQSFRRWLRRVVANKWRDRLRKKPPPRAGGEMLEELADPDRPDAAWEAEHQRFVVRRAMELVRPEFEAATWRACWEFVVEGRPAAEVAAQLGISENAVYVAKHRVLRRLRQELDGLLE